MATFCTLLAAETVKIEGVIVGRSGDEIIVRFGSGAELAFQLTENTQVSQVGGLFNARRKQMALAALIPGLKVKVDGVYNEQRQVLATKINFKGDDLEDAQKIQVGMHEAKMQAQQNKEELERQNAELLEQRAALEKQKAQLIEQQKQVEANRATIAPTPQGSASSMTSTSGTKSPSCSEIVRSRSIPNTIRNCSLWRRRPNRRWLCDRGERVRLHFGQRFLEPETQ